MRHLTAKKAATAIHRGFASLPPASLADSAPREREHLSPNPPVPWSSIRLVSIFCSRRANFLELRGVCPHYSVINQYAPALRVAGYVGRRPLNDEVSTSKSRWTRPVLMQGFAHAGRPLPCALHMQVMNDASPQSGRSRFRTGERKNNANDRGFAN
jgi:hypothetical protein